MSPWKAAGMTAVGTSKRGIRRSLEVRWVIRIQRGPAKSNPCSLECTVVCPWLDGTEVDNIILRALVALPGVPWKPEHLHFRRVVVVVAFRWRLVTEDDGNRRPPRPH